MIKNIIFDLSEVIISGYHGVEKLVEKNTEITAEEFLQRKREMTNLFLDTMRGKFTEDEYIRQLLEKEDWSISSEQLKVIIRNNLNIPVEGTMEIIRKLKNQYKLILLSDHVKEWMKYIFDNNDEINIFDKKYFSYELGKLKSDNGTFKAVLEDSNIRAEETLFIDDYESNINAARLVGINGVQFKNANILKEDLIKMNIF